MRELTVEEVRQVAGGATKSKSWWQDVFGGSGNSTPSGISNVLEGAAIIGGGIMAIAAGPEVLAGAALYGALVGDGIVGAAGGGMIGMGIAKIA